MKLVTEAEIEGKNSNTLEDGYVSRNEIEIRETNKGSWHQTPIVAETVCQYKEKSSDTQGQGNKSAETQETRELVEESQDLPIAVDTYFDNNKENETQHYSSNSLLDDLRVSGSSDDGDFGSSSSDDYNMSCFSYKSEFKDVEYMTMDYAKRGKTYDMITINAVPKAYYSKLLISTDKKKDLLSLLCFIHESAHEFYRSLSCKNDVKDSLPDNYNDSDDE